MPLIIPGFCHKTRLNSYFDSPLDIYIQQINKNREETDGEYIEKLEFSTRSANGVIKLIKYIVSSSLSLFLFISLASRSDAYPSGVANFHSLMIT